MAITIADIRERREFAQTDHPTNTEVQNAIDEAELLYDETTLGARYDTVVKWQTYQILARSHFARDLRLMKDRQATIFDATLNDLIEPVGREERIEP